MKYIIRLLKYAKPYRWLIAVSTISLLVITGLNLIVPWLVKNLIAILENQNLGYADLTDISNMAIILGIAYIVKILFRFCSNYFSHSAAWRLVSDMRIRIYDHFQKLSLKYYHDKQTGQLMSRAINDTGTFETLVAHSIPDIISNVLILGGVTAILFYINVQLAFLTLIPIPFLLVLGFIFTKKILPHFRTAQIALGDLSASMQDNLSGMKEIQVFNQQENEKNVIAKHAYRHAEAILGFLRKSAFFHPTIEAISSMGTVIVVGFGGYLAVVHQIKVSDIVGFLLYLNLFYAPIASLARVTEDFQQALAGAERVFEVLDTEPDITDAPDAISIGKSNGQLEFENVDFHYIENRPIINDINFKIEPGQMVALVGPTGVGKTTIISLIARFYDPERGRILLDGNDIRNLTLTSLRNQISLVLQDIFLFDGTVYDNIAYGRQDCLPEDVYKSAGAAKIHEFIVNLPQGYETKIGERGVKLSGGQKQRLCIARAILRDTPILILDEATASVDVETEREIQQAIQDLIGTRTIIVIAHRLSTVKRANNILVIKDGSIYESGTHEELISQNGLYTDLCKIQFSDLETE
jgi:ABC-type multidrug transport system fused ATPase/permease subunit